jgi:hypothetical protein
MKRLLLGSAFSLAVFAAHAQSALNATDLSASTSACGNGVTCGTVNTSPQICVPQISPPYGGSYPRKTITIANSSAGATISVGYNASITVNGAGTFTLGAGQTAFWLPGTAPGGPLYCVANGLATPVQIVLGN